MAITDARVKASVYLFNSQTGGGLISEFQRFPRYKSGRGFGALFRGLNRRILPIALNVCKSALSAMRDAQEQGESLKGTVKTAMRPATKAAMHVALSQTDKEQPGRG